MAGGRHGEALAEFAAAFALPETSRRDLLRMMAASLALGAASGCGDASAPSGVAVPHVTQPEQQVPGRPRFYATATLFEGFAQPVLVETHEGRPIKIEGNPDHPLGNGGTDAFAQAAVLEFYDPDRSQTVRHLGEIGTWAGFESALADLRRRWDDSGGAGLRLLTGAITSPTLLRQLDHLLARWPEARWHGFEPVGSGLREAALQLTFGRPLSMHYWLDRAEVVVALDEDLLGPGPRQVAHAGAWASRRRAALGGDGNCSLFVAEPAPSLTGAMATARLPASYGSIAALAAALARELGIAAPEPVALTAAEAEWIRQAADALRSHQGRALVAIGPFQPAATQAVGMRINHALGNQGATVAYADPVARPVGPEHDLEALAAAMDAGRVEALFVLQANPVYTSPGDTDFADLMARVPLRLHAGVFYDETAEHSHWHLPLSHPLESWGDARAVDGTTTVLQPTVRPIYDTRSIHELLALLLGEPRSDGLAAVKQTWQPLLQAGGSDPASQEERWRNILRAGFVPDSAPRPRNPDPAGGEATALDETHAEGIEVVFRPDPCIWDGRFANCAWLQELPKPLTKITWDNVAAVSPAFAAAQGIGNGELIEIAASGTTVRAPVWVLPGQADATVTVYLGYGRQRAGRVGNGVGYDAYRLRRSDRPWAVAGATVSSLDASVPLASTQLHGSQAGHEIVRTMPLRAVRASPGADAEHAQPSLYDRWPDGEHAWAMAIDIDLCIGCNACVVACQSENNIPVVGKDQVALGREMHWLRVDRYYAGPEDHPETVFMPVPCMHCEKAPCELGCPVNATVHGDGGLNEMVYNRCIGTRTCSSYCPYKVRRFNWFDYTGDAPPSVQAQRNPDVTVRARGVMEKCTYCIQRISAANRQSHVEGRPIRDGEVVPACQQACPTAAIMFGNAADPNSQVSRWKRSPREYSLLAHLGTRPRTTYLAKVTVDDATAEKS